MLGNDWSSTAVKGKPTSSDTRNPAEKHQVHHSPVTQPHSYLEVRSVEDSLHLGNAQVVDQRNVGALERNRENASALLEDSGFAIFTEAHKRLDGCQSSISGTRGIATLGLEMLEEIHDHWGVELFEFQLRGGHMVALTGVVE